MASPAPAPTVSNIFASMASFLGAVLPADVPAVQGQINRVPERPEPRFVVMMPPRFERIETNVDSYQPAKFTGSITGATMTITAVDPSTPDAQLSVGSAIFGAGVAAGTVVTAGSGQLGPYTVSPVQNVSQGTISAGTKTVTMNSKAIIALDFHAADNTAGDLATTVAALLRDAFGVQQFKNQNPNYGTVPLYADDPQQRPFLNDSQQVEWRWVVEANLQANISVVVPMEFADAVNLGLISVDAADPPA